MGHAVDFMDASDVPPEAHVAVCRLRCKPETGGRGCGCHMLSTSSSPLSGKRREG